MAKQFPPKVGHYHANTAQKGLNCAFILTVN